MADESALTVEDRLARIEKSLETIVSGMQQAPNLVSIAADSVDEMLESARNNGANIDERLKDGLHLLGRLSDPSISQSLNNLLDLLDQGPGLVSMVADTVDETLGAVNRGPVRIDDRVRGASEILIKVTEPSMVEKINDLMTIVNQAPGLISMVADSVDEFMQYHGSDLENSLSFLKKENLNFIKDAGDALAEAQNQTPAKIGGVFSILKLMKDPDRQRALGLLMNVLKNLGNKIK